MKISIVFAYYNRRNLLINTLNSIIKTKYNGQLEIIIVNDASKKEQRIDDVNNLFPLLDIKLINIKKDKKWWINPCIANNIGFAFVTGDVIVLQNPECLHIGDIISYVADNIEENKYLVFGCYAINKEKTKLICDGKDIRDTIHPTNNIKVKLCKSQNKWYQHKKFNPRALNFCAAITNKDLKDLGGFDEKFAKGIAKDDREFICRVNKKGMSVDMVDCPFVVHQYHGHTDYSNKKQVERNNKLFLETHKTKNYKVISSLTKDLINEAIEV